MPFANIKENQAQTMQNIFQYTIQIKGKSFSCPWDREKVYLSFYAVNQRHIKHVL